MNDENMRDLAAVRYDKARELLTDAESLLERDSYTSANNRAFYAAEKAIKAVLASVGKDAGSHNGMIRIFNQEFIHKSDGYFTHEDLQKLQSMERIRNASDYDDFYLASKEECVDQVKKAKEIVEKVNIYLHSRQKNRNGM